MAHTLAGVLPLLAGVAISVLLLLAAWWDISIREIPNWIWAAALVIGLIARAAEGNAFLSPATALAVAFFVVLVGVHALGMMGGGDVKLAAAMAFGLSAIDILRFVEITAFAGGVLAIIYLAGRALPYRAVLQRPSNRLARVLRVERYRISKGAPLPYGVALAAAGILVIAGV